MNRIIYLLIIFFALSCKSKSDLEFDQYYIQGEVLYTKYCSNCHQEDGNGLALLYPPIDKSDFIDNNFPEVICIMRYGKSTPTVVNGKTFSQPMKGVTALTDLDVAEIATYIYNNWDRKRGIVKVDEVAAQMNNCKQE